LNYVCGLVIDISRRREGPNFNSPDVQASFFDILAFEDGKDTLSRNVSFIATFDTQQARKAKISASPPQKLDALQAMLFEVYVCFVTSHI
jgi:hypothetical protein